MTLFLTQQGFSYIDYYNGGYENADSLASLVTTGANSIETAFEYGIDPHNDTVYADSHYTDSLTAIGSTIKEAVADGLSVMVRPLLDFLNPAYLTGTPYSVGDWRTYFNPGAAGSTGANAFFASYKTMLLQYAQVGVANGATSLCIGTELDQITGPAYKSYWDGIISTLRADYPTLKLTYAADWDDDQSPWTGGGSGLAAGTGNLVTQVSFAKELDYFGIDNYAAISDAANPTLAQLIAGWTQTPSDATTLAVTGGESLIAYYESVAAAVGKPLIFTEIGYESATDAASSPAGSSTKVYDPALQALLYQAFFDAWQTSGNASLTGVYFWNWDPNASEVGPGNGANFSPQGEPALTEITQAFASASKLDLTQVFGAGSTLEIDLTTSGSVVKVFDNVSGGETEVDIPGYQIGASQILTGKTDTPYVLDLAAGVVADALTVSAGSVVNGPGALAGANRIYGEANGVGIGSGAVEYVLASGTTAGAVVSNGGYQIVSSGGVAGGTEVLSGGRQYVDADGLASATTVSRGGVEVVLASGTARGTVVSSGGEAIVSAGGVASASVISSGGKAAIDAGGQAVEATVSAGGVLYVLASGTATETLVRAGGYQFVSSGGVAGATRVVAGGRQDVFAGGHASATTLSSGGAQTLFAGGVAIGTIVSSGGEAVVASGGVASTTKVLSGGKLVVDAHGATIGAAVSGGGAEYVLASGTTTATVLSGGGKQLVSAGAVASATEVESGGFDYIYSGGTASGLGVLAGGVLVDDGRVLIAGAGALDGRLEGLGSVVETGGGDLLLSAAGAAFSGQAVISGGVIELAGAAALGTGGVAFVAPTTGSAVLQIDAADAPAAGATFANTISNFDAAGEDIDLRSIAFVSGASAAVVGSTLVLTDGGKTYSFKLAGGVAALYPVLSDGHGGTLIDPIAMAAQPNRPTAVEPQPLVPEAIAFAQAAAAFAPTHGSTLAVISGVSPHLPTPFAHPTALAGAARF
jgi:fibronectin-binding autotransporter adhesin